MVDENLRQEEEMLREEIAKLTPAQKKHYYALEVAQVKDPDTYAALNWAFLAGLHHFYLGKWRRGLINLILMFIGAIFYLSHILPWLGAMVILAVFIIEVPQLFNSQKIVHQYNNQVMKTLIKKVGYF